MLAVPVPVGTTLYHIVFDCPDPVGTQPETEAGTGSFVCVVAPELSLVSANPVDVMLIALAKLSFAGAGATTLNVEPKLVPVTVIRVASGPRFALTGFTNVIVGAAPSTEKMSALLVAGPT